MTNPLSELDRQQAIDLRWTLRDIKAKRWVLSPINPSRLEKLIALGLVEMRNDFPVLTDGLPVLGARACIQQLPKGLMFRSIGAGCKKFLYL